jgi:hypothetical protein
MSRRKFDRYMVQIGAGRNNKFVRFTDSERCAHFLGVLSIAASSPIRGCLLIGNDQATDAEIANEAGVTRQVAASALSKLKTKGILEFDAEVNAWRVHDWEDMNPEPKHDPTAAKRMVEYRDRRRNGARNGGVTA